jgi:chitin synthase
VLLVRDLCGTFCFSMQFVVFMELAGTLVLPAAISFTIYLIVSSAIGDASDNVIPLVLLGIILGLPGLLIVVTSRKIAYIGWMLVYLLSLPIWNFVLPAYAFWHFDDFSWGQTRMVSGEKKQAGGHGDKEGEFDSSHIVMKRWAEFERERRWKLGSHSRDSTYLDPYQSIAPKRPGSHRQSLASMQDSYDPYARPPTFMHSQHSDSPEGSPQPKPRSRQDSAPLLMLPAPLALSNQPSSSVSSSLNDSYIGPGPDAQPNYRLHRAPDDPNMYIPDIRDSDAGEMNSPNDSTPMMSPSNRGINILGQGAVMRSVTGGSSYPGETQNPYRHSQHHVAAYEQAPTYLSPTMEEGNVNVVRPKPRGVSLVDHGVVSSPEGPVRRTKNSSKRASASILSASSGGTQARYKHQSLPPAPVSPVSSNSPLQYLPPGAAAPQPQQFGRFPGQ